MAKQTILFITGNQGKVDEINFILKQYPELEEKYEIKNVDINLPEIQSLDSTKVLEHKLITAFNKINKKGGKYQLTKMKLDLTQTIPVMVEDTSLSFENFNDYSFPGPLIKFYLKSIGLNGICNFHYGKKAMGTTMIGLYDGKIMSYFEGSIMGTVPNSPKGSNGFGWDKIFAPIDSVNNDEHLTFAEMSAEQKQHFSMRSTCARKLAEHLLSH